MPREKWIVEMPVRKHLVLDARSIPTGAARGVTIARAPLGSRTYDDGFTGIASPRSFSMEGGGRRIELELGEDYPYVQIFSPAVGPSSAAQSPPAVGSPRASQSPPAAASPRLAQAPPAAESLRLGQAAGAEFFCIEPMTAAANALGAGEGLRFATAGNSFTAAFRVRVIGGVTSVEK